METTLLSPGRQLFVPTPLCESVNDPSWYERSALESTEGAIRALSLNLGYLLVGISE